MMNIDNGIISERQAFRIALLENITVGMVVIPYITTRTSGVMHAWSFILGIIFIGLYGALMYMYSRKLKKGLAYEIDDCFGWFGKILEAVYALRYVLRAAVILAFFADVIHRYMLRSMNVWVIAVPFLLICGYGASRDIEGRGRLLELLFWWLIVPLILVAVFSVTNVDWTSLPGEMFGGTGEDGIWNVILGAYYVLLAVSGVELMMFTLPRQKENGWKNALKIFVWIAIALALAYTFIVGILGINWTMSDDKAALNVMEASAFPGGIVERMDYPVLAFWVIGVFAIISGYLFYARVFSLKLCPKKPWVHILVIIAAALLFMWGLTRDSVREALAFYLIWIDLAVSVLVPLLVIFVRHRRSAGLMLLFCVLATCTGCQNKYETSSLENRDYATAIEVSIEDGGEYEFDFTVADLTEYNGDSEGVLKTNGYSCVSTGLETAMYMYCDENDRQLDIGHVKKIRIKSGDTDGLYSFAREVSMLPMIAKSVTVDIEDSSGEREILLRDLIKEAYAWEES